MIDKKGLTELMNKFIAGLLGAVGALVVSTSGHAALPPSDAFLHASYAAPLALAPNALETMDTAGRDDSVQAELVYYRRHYRRRHYRRHHHYR